MHIVSLYGKGYASYIVIVKDKLVIVKDKLRVMVKDKL